MRMGPMVDTAVCVSAGIDSTACLFYALNKFGKDRVVAITISLDEERFIYSKSQQFYVRGLCAAAGVQLFATKKEAVQGQEHVKDVYEWSHNARVFGIGTQQIKRVLYGAHSGDTIHEHVALNEKWFAEEAAAHQRDVVLERPLFHLTKQQQYDSIPVEYRKFLWTCVYPTSAIIKHGAIRGYTACGVCLKCQETAKFTARRD